MKIELSFFVMLLILSIEISARDTLSATGNKGPVKKEEHMTRSLYGITSSATNGSMRPGAREMPSAGAKGEEFSRKAGQPEDDKGDKHRNAKFYGRQAGKSQNHGTRMKAFSARPMTGMNGLKARGGGNRTGKR